MTGAGMTRPGRTAVRVALPLLLAATALLTGCARPDQLGASPGAVPVPATQVPAAVAGTPPAPAAPAEIGSGTLQGRITARTPMTTRVVVRTVVLAPGETTGWHRHPGTETTIVNSGEVTVLQADACTPQRFGPGQAMFVPDSEPHVVRNDGAAPAELVVTQLLAPDQPDRATTRPACTEPR